MEDLSHRQLLAVADNFLPLDPHPVRPVHTTTLSNDMTDKVPAKLLYAMCGNMKKDEKAICFDAKRKSFCCIYILKLHLKLQY